MALSFSNKQIQDAARGICGHAIQYPHIAQGSFGVVYTAKNKSNGQTAAVKVINLKMCSDSTKAKDEVLNCLKKVPRSPNIVQYYFDFHKEENQIYLFMEYCVHGDLNKFLNKNQIDQKESIMLMIQIADGIDSLHQAKIIHRDLKPENILIQEETDGSRRVKLCDFGLSKFLDEYGSSGTNSSVGTPRYRAPEFWNKDENGKIRDYKKWVDIFSAGLVFLAIVQWEPGKPLKPKIENKSLGNDSWAIGELIFRRNLKGEATYILEPAGDQRIQPLKDIIKDMIKVRPEERPEAADVSRRLKEFLDGF